MALLSFEAVGKSRLISNVGSPTSITAALSPSGVGGWRARKARNGSGRKRHPEIHVHQGWHARGERTRGGQNSISSLCRLEAIKGRPAAFAGTNQVCQCRLLMLIVSPRVRATVMIWYRSPAPAARGLWPWWNSGPSPWQRPATVKCSQLYLLSRHALSIPGHKLCQSPPRQSRSNFVIAGRQDGHPDPDTAPIPKNFDWISMEGGKRLHLAPPPPHPPSPPPLPSLPHA